MNPRTVKAAILGATLAGSAAAAPIPSTTAATTYHRAQVGGVGIFYREAGSKDAPTIVLLHGFPSSSRGYNMLIPLLAMHYHIVAPDFPCFGQSDAPSPATYSYTFDHFAGTIDALLEQLKITRYTLYLFDYGAPIGFRIILAHPERLQALIVQNGNTYKEGLGPKWAKIAEFWAEPKAHPEVVDAFLSYEETKQRHLAGTSHPEAYDPDSWTDEFAHLSQPGQREIQAALLYDYRTNVAFYLACQAWLREHKPPTLIAWGANDPSFVAAGATAFRADLPDAERACGCRFGAGQRVAGFQGDGARGRADREARHGFLRAFHQGRRSFRFDRLQGRHGGRDWVRSVESTAMLARYTKGSSARRGAAETVAAARKQFV